MTSGLPVADRPSNAPADTFTLLKSPQYATPLSRPWKMNGWPF